MKLILKENVEHLGGSGDIVDVKPVHQARAMGLANRVVAKGTARAAAEVLAGEIAAFPPLCMRHDRLSAHEQFALSLEQALANEYRHGRVSLRAGEGRAGARRFAEGSGRHGRFE